MSTTIYKRCVGCGSNVTSRRHTNGCDGVDYSWAWVLELEPRWDGERWKRRQLRRSGFATQTEARDELRRALAKRENGAHVEPSKVTVAAYLRQWLEATAPPKVAYSTWAKRALHVEWVSARIGGLPLERVSGATLDALYTDLARAGGAKGQPLAPATVRDTHRVLSKAFGDARRWRMISTNPCEDAEPPRLDRLTADARAALQVWTAEQLRTFLAATSEYRHGAAFHVAATTGLRRSELLGLRWADVDLEARRLRVAQTLVSSEDGWRLRLDTKSTGSGRVVALDAGTVAVLERHRDRQRFARRAAGPVWTDHGLVFASDDGSPLSPEALSMAFRRAVAAVTVPRIRLHDLRHTHATLLLLAGEPVKVVAERLGHSSPVVTLTTYSHLLPGRDESAADKFGAMLDAAAGAGGRGS